MAQNIIKISPLPIDVTLESFIQKFNNDFPVKRAEIINRVGYIEFVEFDSETLQLLAFTLQLQEKGDQVYLPGWNAKLDLPTPERHWADIDIMKRQENQIKLASKTDALLEKSVMKRQENQIKLASTTDELLEKSVYETGPKQIQIIEKIIKISPLPNYVTKKHLQDKFGAGFKIKRIQIIDHIGYIQFLQLSQQEVDLLKFQHGDQLIIQQYNATIQLPQVSRTWSSLQKVIKETQLIKNQNTLINQQIKQVKNLIQNKDDVVKVLVKEEIKQPQKVIVQEKIIQPIKKQVKITIEPIKEVINELIKVKEPVKQIIKETAKVIEPVKQIIKQPIKEVKEIVKEVKVSEPIKQIIKETVKVIEPVKQIIKEPIKEVKEIVKEVKVSEPIKQIIKETVKVIEPVKQIIKQIVKVIEPAKEITKETVKVNEPVIKQKNKSKQIKKSIMKIIKVENLPEKIKQDNLSKKFHYFKPSKVQIDGSVGYVQLEDFNIEVFEFEFLNNQIYQWDAKIEILNYSNWQQLKNQIEKQKKKQIDISQSKFIPNEISQIISVPIESNINTESYFPQILDNNTKKIDEQILKLNTIYSQVKKFNYSQGFNVEDNIQIAPIATATKSLVKPFIQKQNIHEHVKIESNYKFKNEKIFHFPNQFLSILIIGFIFYMAM